MSLLLKLPTEIASEIVGLWLVVKEIVSLDSAICHVAKRKFLHESVFQSPNCIVHQVVDRDQYKTTEKDLSEWIAEKGIRARSIFLRESTNLTTVDNYLQEFGQFVTEVYSYECSGKSVKLIASVARNCPNLRSFTCWYCEVSGDVIELLQRCRVVENICITNYFPTAYDMMNIPETHHLRAKCISLNCDLLSETGILRMCAFDAVVAIRASDNLLLSHIHLFVNLHSLRVNCDTDDAPLLQIISQCPFITNLHISLAWLTDESFVAIVRAVRRLVTLNIEAIDGLSNESMVELVKHHKDSLVALYMYNMKYQDPFEYALCINTVLRGCPMLRTISFSTCPGIDYQLLGNITTLIMGINEVGAEWTHIQWSCRNLHTLFLVEVPTLPSVSGESYLTVRTDIVPIVAALKEMPAVKTVNYVAFNVESRDRALNTLRNELPLVRVVDEYIGSWYDLFALPV